MHLKCRGCLWWKAFCSDYQLCWKHWVLPGALEQNVCHCWRQRLLDPWETATPSPFPAWWAHCSAGLGPQARQERPDVLSIDDTSVDHIVKHSSTMSQWSINTIGKKAYFDKNTLKCCAGWRGSDLQCQRGPSKEEAWGECLRVTDSENRGNGFCFAFYLITNIC